MGKAKKTVLNQKTETKKEKNILATDKLDDVAKEEIKEATPKEEVVAEEKVVAKEEEATPKEEVVAEEKVVAKEEDTAPKKEVDEKPTQRKISDLTPDELRFFYRSGIIPK